jgi:hypothetical protein
MGQPRAQLSISTASRLSRVASLFALTTQQVVVLRYHGACAWK